MLTFHQESVGSSPALGPSQALYGDDDRRIRSVDVKCFASILERIFGVQYHPCNLWKLFIRLHWSCREKEYWVLRQERAAIFKAYNLTFGHASYRTYGGRPGVLFHRPSSVPCLLSHIVSTDPDKNLINPLK